MIIIIKDWKNDEIYWNQIKFRSVRTVIGQIFTSNHKVVVMNSFFSTENIERDAPNRYVSSLSARIRVSVPKIDRR